MPDVVRIALVGCGRLAERGYAPAFRKVRGVRLVAVADPHVERCRRVAPGVRSFGSATALLEGEAVDGVVLATPAAAHLADARVAAVRGVPALVEKPPAANVAEARELATLEPGPSMGFNRRFEPEIARLRGIAMTVVGPQIHLQLRTRPSSWRAYVVDDDPLDNLGPHPLDLARWLTGAEIERLRATIDGAAVSLELELAGGATASISLHGDRPYRERVVLRAGDRQLGAYRAGGLRAAARSLGKHVEHPLVPSLVLQLEAFADRVRGEPADDLAGSGDGIAVMAALEAARRSARSGGAWSDVPPPGRDG